MCYQMRFFLCIFFLKLLMVYRDNPGEQTNEIFIYCSNPADISTYIPALHQGDPQS